MHACQNSPSPRGSSEKETFGEMGTKQMVSSARQRACKSVGCRNMPCQAQCFGASYMFWKHKIREHWNAKATTVHRDMEKWLPGMLPEGLRTLAEVCHSPRELLWRACCVNRCRELFEATNLPPTASVV
jgi:hypothetical protein